MSEMDSKIVMLMNTEMVKAEKCEFRVIPLGPHERAMRYAGYQKRIVFYRKSGAASFSDIVNSLKSSLSKVLVYFFPLAGRLILPTMEVDCSNLGVQFSIAITEDITIQEVENSNFEPSEFCDSLCQIGTPTWPWSRDIPLLFVQVTEFACGGFSIGFAFSHQISDGPSAWHFFKSWSEMNKFGSISNMPEVTFSRKCLDMDLEKTLQVVETIGYRLKKQGLHPEPDFVKPDKLKTKRFTVDKNAITRLKSMAMAETGSSNNWFSTYHVLTAYFWRQTTIARCLDAEQRLNFLQLVNCRDRFGGLPTFYFGNAATSTFVVCTVGEMLRNGMGYAANLLRNSIMSLDEEKVQAEVNILEYIMPSQNYLAKVEFDAKGFAMVVSSPRFPVFESDFGYGSPSGVTFGTNDLHEGKLYFFPSTKVGCIDVTVVLQPDALTRLTIDI